jgi:hypothetical protein
MEHLMNRRDALLVSTSALLVAGCTQQQITNVEQVVANVINQVQTGVAQACSAVGKLIPTADSVFAVLAGILGGTNIAVVTAQMISDAIKAIVQVACGTPAPAGAVPGGGINVTAGSTPVVVHFY